jgi:hypothetical protein
MKRWRTVVSGDVASKGWGGTGSAFAGEGVSHLNAGWSSILNGSLLVILRRTLRSRPRGTIIMAVKC